MRMNRMLLLMTDDDMRKLLTSTGTLNRARAILSNCREHIASNKNLKPVAMRKLEYQAILEIAKLLGVELTIEGK